MKKKTETVTRLGVGRKLPVQPTVFIFTVSFVMTVILEVLSRRSFTGLFRFITGNPVAFLINWAVVGLTFAVSMMFRKKAFTVTLATVLWIVIGFVNHQLLGRRTGSPLSASDLQINMDAILMMPVYYTWLQIGLYTLLGCAVVAALVFLFIKTPIYRRDIKSSFLRLFGSALILAVLLLFGLEGGMVSRTLKPSLYDSYLNYGFPYGFVCGFFDTGIQKPEDYSPEVVKQLADNIDIALEPEPTPSSDRTFIESFREYLRTGELDSTPEDYTSESVETIRNLLRTDSNNYPETLPNFIFIQLESFCDPKIFNNYSFEGDPIEYFRSLMDTCPSGKLYVPTVSGGTANTEFEVLTGCNLDFFGTGDFPFYDVLRYNVCESLATDLKTLGYHSTLLHNYTGTFYYRNQVYSNLDFDTFVSVEFMNGYDTTPKGWAKDTVFTNYMLETMNRTEAPDFIYAVTVQTHGAYTELPENTVCTYTVSTELGDEAGSAAEYYLTQLKEVDDFIRELTDTLSSYNEPVVLVMYGDHLPGLSYEVEDIADGNMYETDYVIWTNFEYDHPDDRNIEAYQLSAHTLGMFGLDPGVMIKYHQTRSETQDYLDNMRLLEYDMMYGEHYIYHGASLTRSADMEYGLFPITITDVYTRQGHLFIGGTNFTLDSRIRLNGSNTDTIFVSENLLIAPDELPDPSTNITVGQISADGTVLSETEGVMLK